MEVDNKFSPRAQEDIKLIEAALGKNDQQAYGKLMSRYRDSIYFMILKMVHNRDDAEDLTIEAFGKAFKNLEKYSPEYAFSTWLFKIATNNCIDFIRKKRLTTTSIDQAEDPDEDYAPLNIQSRHLDPEETVIKQQRVKLMREMVKTMNPKYRKLIELRYFKEYSYDEIASELDLPLGTVKAQLFRAKELLFNTMKHKRERY